MQPRQPLPGQTLPQAGRLEGYIRQREHAPAPLRILRVWSVELVPGALAENLQESFTMPLDKDRDNGAGNSHPTTTATATGVKPPTAPFEQARRKFETALTYYQAGDYRKAILQFEHVRQMAGLPPRVYPACLFNIGQANLKLRRFATAILYFETYLQSGEVSEKDRKWAQSLLADARHGAGVSG